MLDRNLVLRRVKTAAGTRYLSEKSLQALDKNRQAYTVDDNLPDALQVGNAVFDALQAFELGLSSGIKNSPGELAAALGREVRDRLGGPLTAVLATGGDAALAVCRALDITSLRPRAELLPGVVWSETGRKGISLATKAGGFGDPRLLLDAALKLLGVGTLG